MHAHLPKPPGPDAARDLHTCIHCDVTATPSAMKTVELTGGGFGYECRSVDGCESRIVRLPHWRVAS